MEKSYRVKTNDLKINTFKKTIICQKALKKKRSQSFLLKIYQKEMSNQIWFFGVCKKRKRKKMRVNDINNTNFYNWPNQD